MASNPMADPTEFQRIADRLIRRIPSPSNQDIIRRYVRERRVKGLKLGTILSDLNALVSFAIAMGPKCLDKDVGRAEILDHLMEARRLRIWRNGSRTGQDTITEKVIPLKPSTLHHHKIVLRAFYKWLRGTDVYPPEVANLGPKPREMDTIVADHLIDEDDLKLMLEAQPDARGRAILAVLYETGLRAQEFCSLNVASARFDGPVGYLRLPKGAVGLKTGAREVFIIDSVPYLQAWLTDHPFARQDDAPLFVSMSRRRPKARFTNGALYMFCIRAGKAAKLRMDTNPHLFRHSAATEKARLNWNESQMRQYFGWSRSSDMPTRYIHFATNTCEQMELARRGMLDQQEKPQPALRPLLCQHCRSANLPSAAFCEKCMMPISPEAIAEGRKRQLAALADDMALMVQANVARLLAEREQSGSPKTIASG
jgi:integrase